MLLMHNPSTPVKKAVENVRSPKRACFSTRDLVMLGRVSDRPCEIRHLSPTSQWAQGSWIRSIARLACSALVNLHDSVSAVFHSSRASLT